MKRMGATPLVTGGIFGGAFAQWWVLLLFARSFGPASLGEYATLSAIATPVFVIAYFGLRDIYLTLLPPVSRQTFILLRLGGVAIGGSVLMFAGPFAGVGLALTGAVVAQKAAEALLDLRYGLTQRALKMHRLGILMILNAMVSLGVTTTLASTGSSMAFTVAGAAAVSMLIVGGDALTGARPNDAPVSASIGTVFRNSVPVTLAQGLLSLASFAPTWVVAGFGTVAQVGVFSAAAFLIVFANIVGATAQTVLLPSFARLRSEGEELLGAARRSFISMSTLAGLGVVLAVAFGPGFLAWVYGPEFALDRFRLLPVVLAAGVVIPAYVLNALLLVLNEYRTGAVVAGGAVFATLILGFALGWLGVDGISAAAWAACAGSTVRLLVSLLRLRSHFRAGAAPNLEPFVGEN